MEEFKRRSTEEAVPEGAEASMPTAAEEEVLALLHGKAEHHQTHGGTIDPELKNRFHTEIEHCECFDLFRRYAKGEVPTLDRMFANMGPLIEAMRGDIEKESDPEERSRIESMAKLLQGREKQINDSIQRYVHSVIRFRHLQQMARTGRDMSRQFADADHARRRAHNALIDSLRVYAQQARSVSEEGYGDVPGGLPFALWNPGDDARDIPDTKTPIFSNAAVDNRDFVRDWAIAADFAQQLKALGDEEYIKNFRDHS